MCACICVYACAYVYMLMWHKFVGCMYVCGLCRYVAFVFPYACAVHVCGVCVCVFGGFCMDVVCGHVTGVCICMCVMCM